LRADSRGRRRRPTPPLAAWSSQGRGPVLYRSTSGNARWRRGGTTKFWRRVANGATNPATWKTVLQAGGQTLGAANHMNTKTFALCSA
jgi:hypothetical protein